MSDNNRKSSRPNNGLHSNCRCYTLSSFGRYVEGTGTLRANGGDIGGGSEVLIVSYQETTGCLSQGSHPGSYNGQDAYNDMLVTEYGRTDCNGIRSGECRNYEGGCPTLNASHEHPIMMSNRKGHNGITDDGTSTTLTSQEKERPIVGTSVVRRLTPLECERLQGMPDDWSKYGINEKGKVYELPDSARYRLQGNGIATPFWRYLLKRISAQYERTPTMGSLFDGQASFPMIWEGINGKGTALWSSEIEKHAVAVAKYHFPEEGDDNGIV